MSTSHSRRSPGTWRDTARTLRTVLDAIPANVALLDVDGQIVMVNAAWSAFAEDNGYAEDAHNWMGRSYFAACDSTAGDDRGTACGAATAIRAVLNGEVAEPLEYACHAPHQERWFRMMVSPARLADGWDGAVVMHVDVTDRVRAETALRRRQQELRRGERRFRELVQHIDDVFYNREIDGRVLYVSPAYEAVWGRSCEQLYGDAQALLEAVHPKDIHAVVESSERLRGGERIQRQYRVVRPDGEQRWVHERAYPICAEDGSVERVVGTIRDVTQSREAERRVKEQSAMLDQASDAIIVGDESWTVRYVNRRAEIMYGHSASDAEGKTLAELTAIGPSQHASIARALAERGQWSGHLEHRIDGATVIVHARWTKVDDSAMGTSGVVAIHSDVTEHRTLEAQLLRAQRLESIGTLAGGIAHDLNNVLAPILMALDVFRGEVDSEEGHQLLDHVQHTAERGAAMVRQVLTFARGAPGRRGALDVAAIADEVAGICRDTFPRRIAVYVEAEDELWAVLGDATQLHQVLMNLCVNARDAMQDRGLLRISLGNETVGDADGSAPSERESGTFVTITVRDTGSGIPTDVQERIFEPFFTTKPPGTGTGLGLSTTFSIVRSHGGDIHVESEPGHGTAFRIRLPAITGDVRWSSVPSPQPAPPRGEGETILVVDDEASIRAAARRVLERHGYRVLLADNGVEGVDVYARRFLDVVAVLSDVNMPVMDGPTMVAALRAIHPGVAVVGSSGYHQSALEARHDAFEGIRFLAKPYTASELLHVIADVLGKYPVLADVPAGPPVPSSSLDSR